MVEVLDKFQTSYEKVVKELEIPEVVQDEDETKLDFIDQILNDQKDLGI